MAIIKKQRWGIHRVKDATNKNPELSHALNIKFGKGDTTFLRYLKANDMGVASLEDIAKSRIVDAKNYIQSNGSTENIPMTDYVRDIWIGEGITSVATVYDPSTKSLYLVKGELSPFNDFSKDNLTKIDFCWGNQQKKSDFYLDKKELEDLIEQFNQGNPNIMKLDERDSLAHLGGTEKKKEDKRESFFERYKQILKNDELENNKVFNFLFGESAKEYAEIFRQVTSENTINGERDLPHTVFWNPKYHAKLGVLFLEDKNVCYSGENLVKNDKKKLVKKEGSLWIVADTEKAIEPRYAVVRPVSIEGPRTSGSWQMGYSVSGFTIYLDGREDAGFYSDFAVRQASSFWIARDKPEKKYAVKSTVETPVVEPKEETLPQEPRKKSFLSKVYSSLIKK